MSKFHFKILLFIFTFTLTSKVSRTQDGKIMGGRAAKSGEFPFIGHLTFPAGKFLKICGCSLVTTTKVVTAGHCVLDIKNGRKILREKGKVYFGTLYLFSDEGQTADVISVKYPKELRMKASGAMMHDYATADLGTPLKISDTVKTMALYSTNKKEFKAAWDEIVASQVPCTVIGWGATNFSVVNKTLVVSPASRFLKMTYAKPWEEEECLKYSWLPHDNMVQFGEVCLLGVKFRETTLPGDSGSPLLCGDYVWGVCTSMVIDDSGTKPFQYLLHWHYLNEFLFPEGFSSAITSTVFMPLVFLIFFLR